MYPLQAETMAQILSGKSVGLLVPTASGKTYAEIGINLVSEGEKCFFFDIIPIFASLQVLTLPVC